MTALDVGTPAGSRRGRAGREGRAEGIRRAAILAAIAGPLLYVALTSALGLLWAGYDPIRQTQSELGAVDAPHALVMNVGGFMGLGVTIVTFAVAYALTLRQGARTWLAVLALLVAGAGMVTVGFFPCDAGCVDVTRTGELHGTFSAPGAIGLPAAMLLSAAAFRLDGRLGPGWQVITFAIGALALAAGPVIQADLLPDVDGLVQRAAMWSPILWMVAVALRFRAVPPGREEGTR